MYEIFLCIDRYNNIYYNMEWTMLTVLWLVVHTPIDWNIDRSKYELPPIELPVLFIPSSAELTYLSYSRSTWYTTVSYGMQSTYNRGMKGEASNNVKYLCSLSESITGCQTQRSYYHNQGGLQQVIKLW